MHTKQIAHRTRVLSQKTNRGGQGRELVTALPRKPSEIPSQWKRERGNTLHTPISHSTGMCASSPHQNPPRVWALILECKHNAKGAHANAPLPMATEPEQRWLSPPCSAFPTTLPRKLRPLGRALTQEEEEEEGSCQAPCQPHGNPLCLDSLPEGRW